MVEMNARERFLTAVAGGQPDRVPLFDQLFCPELYEAVIGRRPRDYEPEDVIPCALGLGLDAAPFFSGQAAAYHDAFLAPDVHVDEWGTTVRDNPAISWPGGSPIAYPIKTRQDWLNYLMPDVHALGRQNGVAAALKLGAGRIAILGGVLGPLTAASWLMGYEGLLLSIYEDAALLHDLLRKVTDFHIEAGRLLLEKGVDALLIADDHAGTYGPLMSLRHFRSTVLPYFAEMVRTFRSWGALVIMHNCGDLRLYLEDLVGTGIHAYHPLERAAHMDLAEVKAKYGSRLCLIGNVDSKSTLVSGTEQEVEEAVLECLRVGAPLGRFVLASDHSFHVGTSLRNVFRMIDTAKRYGQYPLCLPAPEPPLPDGPPPGCDVGNDSARGAGKRG